MDFLSFAIFIICFIGSVSCGEYCYDNGRTFYCDYGCCGDYGDEYCCGVYSWIIVVAVIGGIGLISFVVIVYCVWKKQNAKKGRVINTTPQTQTTTFIHVPPQTQPPAYQQQPPAYNNQLYSQNQPQAMYPPPPPANYGADPAYPPVGN
ncbi:cysteine and tyrosine-rich protein 1-like isoform X2 [Ruditapes philippinarum]|uniref:cysteine and tyrosine-rich protein 1-like isoform X1 n=1 Tax=Ruditapes philippinarum TaxID=129788 RepID=UPI00295AE90F|nr:cysteine and tyrosine-rich protein 1-like isoform X1 [Ruditapes philippinarum]XP_060551114.1 cysteine and tyrosine-rich protein 1-like isoform X2 [Ruditapes philippinarum]